MDKVYVRLLSVSLLISLCGAGLVTPGVSLTAAIRDALVISQTEAQLAEAAAFNPNVEADRRSLSRIRNFFSTLSGRISSLCAKKAAVGVVRTSPVVRIPSVVSLEHPHQLTHVSIFPNNSCALRPVCFVEQLAQPQEVCFCSFAKVAYSPARAG